MYYVIINLFVVRMPHFDVCYFGVSKSTHLYLVARVDSKFNEMAKFSFPITGSGTGALVDLFMLRRSISLSLFLPGNIFCFFFRAPLISPDKFVTTV